MKQTAADITRLVPLVLSLFCLVAAADEPAAGPMRSFGFRPLELYDFEDGTGDLIVRDINGDGLDDVLFANNRVSRLEILLSRADTVLTDNGLPALEERFDNRGMIVDQALKELRVADVDDDGRPDILTFGTAIGLQLRLQQQDGSFADPRRIFVQDPATVMAVRIHDLNGDGKADILVCRRDRADILWNTEGLPFNEKKTLTFSADKCYTVDIADINSDGLPDLAFHFSYNRNPLRIRFGEGEGQFGVEHSIDLPPRQFMKVFEPEGAAPVIGMILRNRLAFRMYDFSREPFLPLLEAQEAAPSRIGLEGSGTKLPPAWTAADFNGDGYGDLLVAAPELSQLHLYRGSADGMTPEPQRIDSLSDVSRISRLAGGDLLVVSRKEKIAALHAGDAIDRFPTILTTPGDVLAGCGIESGAVCWFVCKDEEKNLSLVRLTDRGAAASAYPLDLQNEPSDLLAFRLPDAREGLILFMPYDTPRMFLFAGASPKPVTSEAFRALAQRLSPANIQLEVPGDGTSLIVAQDAIARRFEWIGDRYEVTRQFNPENPGGDLAASCSYSLLDGSTGTLLYDRNAGDIVRFDSQGERLGKMNIPDASPTIFAITQLRSHDRDALVLLDQNGINEILGSGSRLAPVSKAEYISPSEEARLAYARMVRIGSDAEPMLVLVDPANRALELVSLTDNALQQELLFEVFLSSDFVGRGRDGGTEPHDVESGDLNGDGIADLVVLSQDKLLIYPGE